MSCRIQEKIGEGAFSSVSKGSWTRMGQSYDVAVKSLIQNSSEIDKIKLLQEAAIMGQFQHPNIVKLFGVTKEGNLVSVHTCCTMHALRAPHTSKGLQRRERIGYYVNVLGHKGSGGKAYAKIIWLGAIECGY